MDKDLERNIKLTPQQRINEHQKALNLVLELEKVRKVKIDARFKSSS
jgi:hypothetical protein